MRFVPFEEMKYFKLKKLDMKTTWFFTILALLLLNSCKKNFDAQFHVKIINPATGEGYANTKFFIRSERTGINGEVLKTEAEGTTNDLGEAVILVKIKGNKSYYVTTEALPNICYINNIRKYYNDRSNKNPEFVFEIAPCGKIKVNIHNVNCEGPNDTLILERNYQDGSDNVYLPITITGCYSQPGVAVSVPMGNYEIKWKVIRSGVSQTFTDMLFVPKEGEGIGEYTINY
jgi:hypothetical protein